MSEPLTKSGDWSYCPACGGRIDTGYECGQCGRDWLEYHQTGAALRAQLEKYQRDKQIGDVLMLEGSQKIDELRAQLAQVTAELDCEKNNTERLFLENGELSVSIASNGHRDELRIYNLEHQLAEAQATISELQQANSLVVSLQRECRESRIRIKELESEKHAQQCQDMEGT